MLNCQIILIFFSVGNFKKVYCKLKYIFSKIKGVTLKSKYPIRNVVSMCLQIIYQSANLYLQ